MSEREKGVATMPCPGCGSGLPAEEQADGSTAAGTCPRCYPSKEKAERRVTRERATDVQEDQQ